MRSRRDFSFKCEHVFVPTKLIDTAETTAPILVYQAIYRMCAEVGGWVQSPIRLIARDAKIGLCPTRLALQWLEYEGWIRISKPEGCAYSYLANLRQVANHG